MSNRKKCFVKINITYLSIIISPGAKCQHKLLMVDKRTLTIWTGIPCRI